MNEKLDTVYVTGVRIATTRNIVTIWRVNTRPVSDPFPCLIKKARACQTYRVFTRIAPFASWTRRTETSLWSGPPTRMISGIMIKRSDDTSRQMCWRIRLEIGGLGPSIMDDSLSSSLKLAFKISLSVQHQDYDEFPEYLDAHFFHQPGWHTFVGITFMWTKQN